jgi:hypothetical protein
VYIYSERKTEIIIKCQKQTERKTEKQKERNKERRTDLNN